MDKDLIGLDTLNLNVIYANINIKTNKIWKESVIRDENINKGKNNLK
jgi:hypothetical protein